MPSTTRSAGTAKRNGAAQSPIIPASIGRPTLNPSSAIGKASAGETKRHLQNLVKNNLAFDLKHSAAEVWLLGPEAENLAKNNLAFSQVLILRRLPARPGSRAAS